ncbi:MAG: hypothetical protein R2795_15195 [Saprospiraceae bacterium]
MKAKVYPGDTNNSSKECIDYGNHFFSFINAIDGLKITAPVFDSLKFSKQATKRSLRENIRESVEKMGVVISVFSL